MRDKIPVPKPRQDKEEPKKEPLPERPVPIPAQ